MDPEWYRSRVRLLAKGKRVAGWVYLHSDALSDLEPALFGAFKAAVEHAVPGHEWNVAKLNTRLPVVSALWYPQFREDAHPALSSSARLDLGTGRVRVQDYSKSGDPPILHRKETFLAPSDPDAATYAALTQAEEAAGLYENTAEIGRLSAWKSILDARGLTIEGHTLKGSGEAIEGAVEVQRHKTALARRDLSRPVQLLLTHGLLQDGLGFFDYGCGHGDDVRALQATGFAAEGWDPVFRPDAERTPADVVNLGYVLNVIEDPAERKATLRQSYELCRRCLCVSVLVGTASHTGEVRPYGDGVLTSRGTFQKYFRQEEAATLIRETLEADPVALDPGVFVVFRQAEAQNDFLLSRVRGAVPGTAAKAPPIRRSEIRSALVRAFRERNGADWDEIVAFVSGNGRMPAVNEWAGYSRAGAFGVREADLRTAVMAEVSGEQVRLAETERRNSLLAFLAICRFRRVPKLSDLPPGARHDIRHHFGSYRDAIVEAEAHLFSIGDATKIAELCANAPVGLNSLSGFFFQQTDLAKLDPVLQIYCRVGELLGGDLESAHVVKIHKKSPKVSLMRFQDYETAEYPVLLSRTKIDLQNQQVRFYNHANAAEPEVWVGKGLLGDSSAKAEGPDGALALRLLAEDRPLGAVTRRGVVTSLR